MRSEHRCENPVGRLVAVGEGLDVDQHLLAHVDAALERGRAHVRQQHHVVEFEELGVHLRLVFVNIETGTAEFGVPYPDGVFDTHGWYIAFAPFDRPQIAVAVYLEYGVGQTHAGPVAKEILEAYFALPPASPSRVAR